MTCPLRYIMFSALAVICAASLLAACGNTEPLSTTSAAGEKPPETALDLAPDPNPMPSQSVDARFEPPTGSRVLYVSAIVGNDGNDGLSETQPFKTIQHAADLTQPGDVVLIMNGSYASAIVNDNVVTINRSGLSDAWIAYKAYPGHVPILNVPTSGWSGLQIRGASYILVEGLQIVGAKDEITYDYAYSERSNLNNPATSANGIGINAQFNSPNPHHIIIRKNIVRKFGGGCLFSMYADYVTFEDNDISECGWWSPWGNSGISTYQSFDSDSNAGVKMIIRRNRISGNWNYIPFYYGSQGKITDGNGIIVDDLRHTQAFVGDSARFAAPYKGTTLVENNVTFNNGGRGINVYSSDNVIVRNNVSYKNANHPDITGGDVMLNEAGNVRMFGNIIVPRDDRAAVATWNASGPVFDYNVTWGGTAIVNLNGTNNRINVDPRLVDPAAGDFRLQADSPAIDLVPAASGAGSDILRNARPMGAASDAGAYETR